MQLKLADQILAEDKHQPLYKVRLHFCSNSSKVDDDAFLKYILVSQRPSPPTTSTVEVTPSNTLHVSAPRQPATCFDLLLACEHI